MKEYLILFFTLIKTHDGMNPSASTQVTSPWTSCITITLQSNFSLILCNNWSTFQEIWMFAETYLKIQSWISFWLLENNFRLTLKRHIKEYLWYQDRHKCCNSAWTWCIIHSNLWKSTHDMYIHTHIHTYILLGDSTNVTSDFPYVITNGIRTT